MGMERLQELAPFVKDALHQTARVANAFCFLHVANTYLCSVAKLVGPSMLPTFNHGTYVLTESITSRLGAVGSGDAVLIRSPEEPRKVVAKRVKVWKETLFRALLMATISIDSYHSIHTVKYTRIHLIGELTLPSLYLSYGPRRTSDQLAKQPLDLHLQDHPGRDVGEEIRMIMWFNSSYLSG
ncbi:UNVERIFIED_CONTAM: hypothetical protein Scaly_1310200 [Sesamum calycinum]|uniref:Peptidase S26 domain-containing protein n=1 Tax=Sesamum calycinum TaxID=2727403 RepID=A0AAW2Q7S5_9LAMI